MQSLKTLPKKISLSQLNRISAAMEKAKTAHSIGEVGTKIGLIMSEALERVNLSSQ